MKKTFNKTICLFLLISLNWGGFFAIGQTFAYFNDTEISQNNTMDAGKLDFALSAQSDFQPDITLLQNSAKTITVQDNSTMDYNYRVRVDNLSGGLCEYLLLSEGGGGLQPLTSFVSADILYSEKQEWNFEASLNIGNPGWEGKICQFDFVYEGWQENMEYSGGGFLDAEVISNLITNIEPEIPICMKINEVYYDPGVRQNTHGVESDPNDEWIELYNSCDYEVNLKDWHLYDNKSSEHLNHNYVILPHQFVVIAANASTWTYWPDIPDNAFKIALGGTKMFNGLSNDGDAVLLYDNQGNRIDEVSWGNDTTGLNPPVPDVPEGHSISRKEKGVDTNTNADWMDTYSGSAPPGPNPGTNPHAPDGSLLLPAIVQDLLIEEINETTGENQDALNEDINDSENSAVEIETQNVNVEESENIDESAILEEEYCIKEENEKSISEIIDEIVSDVYGIDIEPEKPEGQKELNETETNNEINNEEEITQPEEQKNLIENNEAIKTEMPVAIEENN